MRVPIRTSETEQGQFLEFDCDAELVSLVGPDGELVRSVTWESLVQLVSVLGRREEAAESRKVPRAALALRIAYRLAGGRETVSVTRDIGAGGVFIETASPLPRGTEVEVEFRLPDPPFEPVVAKGRVVWSRASAERHVFLPGMGLQFIDISAGLQSQIAEFVKHLNETRRAA